ncbi:MAG: HEPN domain-containing protein [Nitrososphaeria archaeon]
MNNLAMATAYFEEACRRIGTAKRALEEGAYSYCIRQSQEAVELSLKASLRLVGVEPPKWHDVGPALIELKTRFPQWF